MHESKKNSDGWVKTNLIYVDFRTANMSIELEWTEMNRNNRWTLQTKATRQVKEFRACHLKICTFAY